MWHSLIRSVFAVVVGGSALAQEPQPVVVLSDTVEYCTHLQHMILQKPVRPADVNALLEEGRRMCEDGQVRGGIARLRRALRKLRHRPVAP